MLEVLVLLFFLNETQMLGNCSIDMSNILLIFYVFLHTYFERKNNTLHLIEFSSLIWQNNTYQFQIAIRYHFRVYIEWRVSHAFIKVIDLSQENSPNSSVCNSICTSPIIQQGPNFRADHVNSLPDLTPVMVTSDNGSTVTLALPMARATNFVRNMPSASISDTFIVFTLPQNTSTRKKLIKETYV